MAEMNMNAGIINGTDLTIQEYFEVLKSHTGDAYVNEWADYFVGDWPKPHVCFNTSVHRDSIKHLVDALGDLNPLYRDPEYAKNTKYGTLVAPPSWPFTIVYGHYPPFAVPQFLTIYCGDEIEFFQPVADGDQIDWRTTFPTDVTFKETKTAGPTIFCEGNHEFKRHQGGIPLAKHKFTTCYMEMMKTKYQTSQGGNVVPEYTEEYIEKVYAAQDNEKIWGATPHYFEDVTVGETLNPVVRGPFTVSEMGAWLKGASQIYFCSDRLHRFIHDATGWGYYNPKLKIWHNFHENEYDYWGVMHDELNSYYPGGFGSQRLAWAAMMCTNWASDEGFLWKIKVRHVRKGGYNNVFWTQGTVVDKHCENGRCWVDIDIKTQDQTDATLLVGSASIILPSKEYGNVIYPSPAEPFTSFHA